jgi:acetyl-CoA acyltransferase
MAEAVAPKSAVPDLLAATPVASLAEEIGARADTVWTRTRPLTPPPGGQFPMASSPVRSARQLLRGPRGRVAIVDGCRTPFAKAGTELAEMDVIDLAGAAAAELVARCGIGPDEIERSIFGCVVPALHAPNLGREVVFRASLAMRAAGSAVNLACASSNRAITSAAEAILVGDCDVVLAGGAESLSNVPIQFARSAAKKLMALDKAKSIAAKLGVAAKFRPRDLVPVAPAIAEYTTGMSMGQACEKMAKENEVSRQAQDEVALRSHQRAATAVADGRLAAQIVPVFPPPSYGRAVLLDNGVRADTTFAALAKLKPVFDRRYGTLTAGNSSPITDGGAAVLLMSEDRARSLGHQPLGYIRSWAYAAVDPAQQLLQGPAYAAPLALDKAGLRLRDIELIEMHEAFAAQLVSNLKAFASRRFAHEELGRPEPMGEVDLDKLNVTGGSLAIGHPFGATGARITIQLLYELRRRNLNLGLLTVCAAGGVGFAMVVERT